MEDDRNFLKVFINWNITTWSCYTHTHSHNAPPPPPPPNQKAPQVLRGPKQAPPKAGFLRQWMACDCRRHRIYTPMTHTWRLVGSPFQGAADLGGFTRRVFLFLFPLYLHFKNIKSTLRNSYWFVIGLLNMEGARHRIREILRAVFALF